MSTRGISCGKGGQCIELTTLPPRLSRNSEGLKLLEPYGPVQACKEESSTLYLPIASEALKYGDTLNVR